MEAITKQFFSHMEVPYKAPPFQTMLPRWNRRSSAGTERQFQLTSNAKVRESLGYSVTSFRDLVGLVAELASNNPEMNLYYRGQTEDYRDQNQRTKIYPSLYRPRAGKSNLQPVTIQKRIKSLREAIDLMRRKHRVLGLPATPLSHHDEYYQALLQHYELRATPLIDISVSLRVAASFALDGNVPEAFLYVVNLPLPTGSISHFVDPNMVLIRLQSVCPPVALRPHYQEGYLVGQLRSQAQKLVGDNLAKRVVGKYRLLNPRGAFWDQDFPAIPRNALLPANDLFGEKLTSLLSQMPRDND